MLSYVGVITSAKAENELQHLELATLARKLYENGSRPQITRGKNGKISHLTFWVALKGGEEIAFLLAYNPLIAARERRRQ